MSTRDRVLYAEDEYATRRLMQFTLNQHGVQCDLAADGIEALAMFDSQAYSLVMLDQYMPRMNGNEVAERIRSTNQSVPLIAITSDDSQVPILMKAGFDRVFLKPLRGQDYIDTILSYL